MALRDFFFIKESVTFLRSYLMGVTRIPTAAMARGTKSA